MFQSIVDASKAQPRPYQERVVTKAVGLYTDTGINSALIESPTGSGKTVMALLIAKWMQEKLDLGIGWVAMRRNLLTQAERANAEDGLGIGVQDIQFISMFDKNPPLNDKQGRPIGLLVVDEAQHDAADSMATIHNRLRPQYVLGLTATPFRTDRIKLCFDKVIKDAGIHALIEQGYLSQYNQYTIPTWDVDAVVGHYLRDPEKWGKSVFFWHKREDANRCTQLLRDAGVAVDLVVSDDDPKQERREAQLAAFDRGDLQALVNMFILTEGFDCPSLKTVWVRDSGKGCTIQMAGRVFRKHEGMPLKQVVQSKSTRWPIQRTAKPERSHVWKDERWVSFDGKSKRVAQVTKLILPVLARMDTHIPTYILNKKQKPRRFGGNNNADLDRNTESGLARRDDSGFRSDGNWTGGFGGGAIIH